MNRLKLIKEWIKCVTDDRYESYELQEEYVKDEYRYKKEEEPEFLKENNINSLEDFGKFADYAVYLDFWDYFRETIGSLGFRNIQCDTDKNKLGIKFPTYNGKNTFHFFDIHSIKGDIITLKMPECGRFDYNLKTNKVILDEEYNYYSDKYSYGLPFGLLYLFLNWKAKKKLRNLLSAIANLDITINQTIKKEDELTVINDQGATFHFYMTKSIFLMDEVTRENNPDLKKYEDKKLAIAGLI